MFGWIVITQSKTQTYDLRELIFGHFLVRPLNEEALSEICQGELPILGFSVTEIREDTLSVWPWAQHATLCTSVLYPSLTPRWK